MERFELSRLRLDACEAWCEVDFPDLGILLVHLWQVSEPPIEDGGCVCGRMLVPPTEWEIGEEDDRIRAMLGCEGGNQREWRLPIEIVDAPDGR
jgi:hypothetical protein